MFGYIPDWLVVGEVAKAAVPTMIAAIVAWVAVQQWLTARDKLALDLFDRRHAVWREATEAYTQALRDLMSMDEDNGPLWVPPGLAAFGRAKEKAYFLFGADVLEPWQRVEMALFQLGQRRGRKRGMLEDDDAFDFRLRQEDNHSTTAQVGWEQLRKAIEPYMMMGKIAVSRPARAKRV